MGSAQQLRCLGGSSGAGTSTISETLARNFGLAVDSTGDAIRLAAELAERFRLSW